MPNDFVYIDASNGVQRPRKLVNLALCPFRVLAVDQRAISIDHNGVVQRVSVDRAVQAAQTL